VEDLIDDAASDERYRRRVVLRAEHALKKPAEVNVATELCIQRWQGIRLERHLNARRL